MPLLEELACAFVKAQAAQHVLYTEVRYSPHMLTPAASFDFDEGGHRTTLSANDDDSARQVVEVVTRGLRRGCAEHPGTEVVQILCFIDGKPHCFSSSAESFDDEFNAGELPEDWLVEPFRFDKSAAEAMADLKDAVAAYPPGQRGIDGGGFEIITSTPDYLYVQFQSLRKGYIDDMEFSLAAKTGVCNVRTSSRLGYLDLGVNAKRYAWFADRLGKTAGWKTVPLKAAKHGEYFSQNNLRDSDLAAK